MTEKEKLIWNIIFWCSSLNDIRLECNGIEGTLTIYNDRSLYVYSFNIGKMSDLRAANALLTFWANVDDVGIVEWNGKDIFTDLDLTKKKDRDWIKL